MFHFFFYSKRLTINREQNQVSDPAWIRKTMDCNLNSKSEIFFFRGINQTLIKNDLCNLNDASLAYIVTYISSEINFNGVRQLVKYLVTFLKKNM